MTKYFKRSLSAALFFVFAAQMAQAQVTAQDVWAEWKSYTVGYGYELTGTESLSGNTLTISDLSLSMTIPEDEGVVSIDMKSLVLTSNSDGTVSVTMASTMPISIVGPAGGDDFAFVINYTQNGVSMIVSGTPTDMISNYTASQVNVALASIFVDGETVPADLVQLNITLTNLISSTQMKLGELRNLSQRGSIDSLTYDLSFSDPDSGSTGAFNGSILGVSFQGDSALPLVMDTEDFLAMIEAGFALDGVFEYASGNSSMNVDGDGEQFAFTNSSQGGRLGFAMGANNIVYDVSQKGTMINVTSNQLPFPVAVEMAESGFRIDVPVAQSDDEQDFAFNLKLRDFKMSDLLWGMVDPGAVLPRDPATIILDLTGKAMVLANLLDPEVIEDMDAPPGELNALTINELLVSVAGAKLSGSGDFTFDNDNLATFDGMPAPTGALNLELSGANGLMDKLIQMGLLSDNDAMGARMMMGMLAVPGDGPDSLKSKIEVTEDGQILANGQRIR